MTSPADEKRKLRLVLRSRRAEIAPPFAAAAAMAVRDHLIAEVTPAPGAMVAAYWPMGDELDARPSLAAFAARGHPCALPVVIGRGRPLAFRAWDPGDALEPGGFGTSVPSTDKPVCRPDLVLVPLLGFDRRGFRLGYGGGYYDMTIAALRQRGGVATIGLAFAAQEVETLPVEPFDQRLDGVVTENGMRRFVAGTATR